MTSNLTPYDTGKRAEPKPWPTTTVPMSELPPTARGMEEDRFGKVDFDDDAGETLFTMWVERNERGRHVVHIQDTGGVPIAVEMHRGW